MAGFRNVAILAVLAVFMFASVAGNEDTAIAAAPRPSASSWDQFIAYQEAQQQQQSAQDLTSVGTMAAPAKGWTITVGKGGYKTIQQAIDSIPKGNKKRVTIFIRNGVYRQKLLLKDRHFVYFKCESRKVVITWGDTAEKAGGTSKSASTAIESDGFIASDCTFMNSAPAPPGGAVGKQAVALRIQGDQGAFYRCGFFGAQDTLYDKEGRHYFRNCLIVGSIDFVFGNGQSIYELCNIRSIAKGFSGSITAQDRESNSMTGFVFLRCNIYGTGTIYWGRAWGAYSRVVFIECKMANMIRPIGWHDWEDPKRQKTAFYAEYMCTGPGANRKGRAPWSRVLTKKQAGFFTSIDFIGGKSWVYEKV
jgi:pectinesterase